MVKIIFNVQGMMCPRCEARVTGAVQGAVKAEHITASHKKGTVTFICAHSVDAEAVKGTVEAAGYPVTAVAIKKKGPFGLWV